MAEAERGIDIWTTDDGQRMTTMTATTTTIHNNQIVHGRGRRMMVVDNGQWTMDDNNDG
jgi:phage pi2 protein 07